MKNNKETTILELCSNIKRLEDVLAAARTPNGIPSDRAAIAQSAGISELELNKIIKLGNQAKSDLYLRYKGMIVKIARQYSMKSNLDDLIQEGFFGLVKAAQKFDTRKGSSFDCVAFMWIRNEIQVALKRHYMASYEFDTINERLVLSLEHEQKTVWDLADVEHLVKLSEHEKSLLQLRFQGSMTLHEIAARNRCSHETARRHLNKVINKLRLAYLEEQCA